MIKSNEKNMQSLSQYISIDTIGVLAGYHHEEVVNEIISVTIMEDNYLLVRVHSAASYKPGNLATVHLDSRVEAEILDSNLLVYRISYKGIVEESNDEYITLMPLQYDVTMGYDVIERFQHSTYEYPLDIRPITEFEIMGDIELSTSESLNYSPLGVLITKGVDHPHTTVMAYLALSNDTIVIISPENTFKAKLLQRDHECWFAIDNREALAGINGGELTFTILHCECREVPIGSILYNNLRTRLIEKNPFEKIFLETNNIAMYCLIPI